jgi:hypothetical protein
MLMSMRADFLGELQKDEPLYKVHRKIDVPPLREVELREVVSRPAELLSAQFETALLVDIITRRTAEDSVKDVGALPLLSYTLDDMWTQMVKRGDGVLRLPTQSFEIGGVLVDRADAFLAAHPKSADELRRVFTLKLATVREGEEPSRRRAPRSEFSDEEWRLVSELADHPNRLLVTSTTEGRDTYAEVAHEAIFGSVQISSGKRASHGLKQGVHPPIGLDRWHVRIQVTIIEFSKTIEIINHKVSNIGVLTFTIAIKSPKTNRKASPPFRHAFSQRELELLTRALDMTTYLDSY